MREHGFDALIRRAAGAMSRRTSLLALGAMALTGALGQDVRAEAGCSKTHRRCKEHFKRKIVRMCTRQRTQCVNVANAFCNGDLGCVATHFPCCDLFNSNCNATAALECLVSIN